MRLRPASIAVAGNKDRRAATSQRCSVRHQRAEALARLNPGLRGMKTGDYAYMREPLYVGQHAGNEFVITVKNCRLAAPAVGAALGQTSSSEGGAGLVETFMAGISARMDDMFRRGWINYFGQQRFGTHAVGTHEVGKLILKGDLEGAVNAILAYDPDKAALVAAASADGDADDKQACLGRLEPAIRDDAARSKACMVFQTTGDAQEALRWLPRRFAAEERLISHLGRNESSRRDFYGAVGSIMRNLRSIYLHAYQSLVWNYAASRRWALFGDRVVEGDLVVDEESQPTTAVGGEDAGGAAVAVDDDDDVPVKARPLTAAEVESGRFSVFDVVLPTPGYDVAYPANEVGKEYVEFMGREENGALDPHAMRRLQRDFSLPGRYRKLVARFLAKPGVEVRSYTDENEQMHPTDLDVIREVEARRERELQLQRREGRAESSGEKANGQAAGVKRGLEEDPSPMAVNGPESKKAKLGAETGDALMSDATAQPADGSKGVEALSSTDKEATSTAVQNKVAVVLKFQLGKSAYATIVLRELMGQASDGKA